MYENAESVHRAQFERNGASLIPPKWMFAPWLQVHTHTSEEIKVRSDVLLKVDDVPYSHSINIGKYYFPSGCCFDQESINELTTENEEMLASGIASTAYFNSMVDVDWEEGYSEALEADIFLKNSSGQPYTFDYNDKGRKEVSLIDFTSDGAKEWFQSKMQVALDSKFSGFMYDYGEYVPPFSEIALAKMDLGTTTSIHWITRKLRLSFSQMARLIAIMLRIPCTTYEVGT